MIANGIDLDTLAFNIRTRSGRSRTPPRRGKNVDVSGRSGTVWTPGKKHTSNTIVLPMWVIGADEEGRVPRDGTMRELFQANLDRLLRLFSADTVELLDPMPDGSVRRIVGQVLDVIDPDIQAGGTRAEFAVSLTTTEAYWADVNPVSASKTGTGRWEVVPFSGATAVMEDLALKFTGPSTNPKLTNPKGVFCGYNAVLTDSQSVIIDCAAWTVTGVGFTAAYSSLNKGGDARWFVLEPGDPVPVCTYSQTAGTTGTAALTGRRKFVAR